MNRSRDTSSTALDVVGRLSEVSRLAGQLADRVLGAQIASQPIPEAQIHALLDAAIILDASAMKLPPLLEQMIGKVEDDERDNPAAGCKADGAGGTPSARLGRRPTPRGQRAERTLWSRDHRPVCPS